MKTINLHGNTDLSLIRGGTDSLYWATDDLSGDLYEAEMLFRSGHELRPNHLFLVDYPSGTVHEPIPSKANFYFGTPIFYENTVYILAVDFSSQQIGIYSVSPITKAVTNTQFIPLCEVESCYNLMLHKSPLMLTRQSSDNTFQLVWPEKTVFTIHSHESFLFRENDQLYFSMWHEDPEYREEIIVRSVLDGSIADRLDGTITEMPNGDLWHLK